VLLSAPGSENSDGENLFEAQAGDAHGGIDLVPLRRDGLESEFKLRCSPAPSGAARGGNSRWVSRESLTKNVLELDGDFTCRMRREPPVSIVPNRKVTSIQEVGGAAHLTSRKWTCGGVGLLGRAIGSGCSAGLPAGSSSGSARTRHPPIAEQSRRQSESKRKTAALLCRHSHCVDPPVTVLVSGRIRSISDGSSRQRACC
jgi:hypothetical protein